MEEQLVEKGGRGMEEAPENGKESSHSAHANGMNEYSINLKQSPTKCTRSFMFKYSNN